ncbi:ISLre2 family transposase [Fervidibacillus halotolerans]|uniref:ISLre2 family transposase n=1 Tax=Fervidibacillus halotolerans TaxID=2980027 RepID=A0A9E8M2B8_9BACI|nr:ISLre2 family transposase [Fervidibacillus halotolerans]WAA12927.1 ISLre2 family transposase [Fervidibacillus halotolerans]WAA12930.1 ISLre2 family transposase [Fervidibacillus halotolerans]WAA13196.1 ISLre2 family transposase [Fervidibacillus halotolerans]
MNKNTTKYPTLKEIELLVWRQLQETYSVVMKQLLEAFDQIIAEKRDKKRYRMMGKRTFHLDSLFGQISFKRNYYKDRKAGKYVFLLDRYLGFEGAGSFSPLVEEAAIVLAVKGPSFRKAAQTFETLFGYSVISHETIRQHLLQAEIFQKEKESVQSPVLFVEVDGLYTKRQGQGKKGKEEKIAAVHQGWEKNGKRTQLKNKRHFVHDGKLPFWEAFEEFLVENFEYDPMVHKLIINGDGASWITACRAYFKDRAFYTIDRFHVAKAIRSLFRKHPRYRKMRVALASFDRETLLTELNSAVGTLEDEEKEKELEALIHQLEMYPEALRDYREWLREQGIDTKGMRLMGSAEAMMHVFANRLKNGRSWSDEGISAMMTGMVAILDQLPLKTMFGRVEQWNEEKEEKKPAQRILKKVKSVVTKVTRDNIAYLKGRASIPMYQALKEIRGI